MIETAAKFHVDRFQQILAKAILNFNGINFNAMYRLTASQRLVSILSIILVSCLLLLTMSAITPDKNQVFARCPNGTHKSPSGDCETVVSHTGLPRCPNGFHRSPSGVCEQVGSSASNEDSGSLNTVSLSQFAESSNNNPTPSSRGESEPLAMRSITLESRLQSTKVTSS
jgi:hypothetical protein